VPIKKTWQVGALSITAAMAMASPALAATAQTPPDVPPIDESTCAHPDFTQALLPFGDSNLYTLAPGGAFANATDWQLANGASITTTVQPDGTAGGVLDLPGKGQATSPVMCITSDYPTARLWVRNLEGGDTVSFNVQYYRDGAWTKPKDNGGFKGDKKKNWTLSQEMPVSPDVNNPGWQQVRFTLLGGGDARKLQQVDSFWVDPRASR
jgi:hypothetical protein